MNERQAQRASNPAIPETPSMAHRRICERCRTMPYLCPIGAMILARSMQWHDSGTRERREPNAT